MSGVSERQREGLAKGPAASSSAGRRRRRWTGESSVVAPAGGISSASLRSSMRAHRSATSTPDPALPPTTTPAAPGSETPTPTYASTQAAGASCERITIDDSDYGFVNVEVEDYGEKYEYEGGGRIRFHVRNDNEVPAYLTDSSLDWFAGLAPPMYLDYFKFKGNRYFRTDSYSSPAASAAPAIGFEGSKWWEAVFNLKGQPSTGTFTVSLTFNVDGLEGCTVTTQTQIP